jgi:predicted dehydrogenase
MESSLKVSVFGAGVFAGYHAAKVAAHPRGQLVGIYDPNSDKAEALANAYHATAFETAEAAINACDAVICAVPSVNHQRVAIPALAAGRSLLIEKPLADQVGQAKAIIAAAGQGGGIVQVGHQERIVVDAIGLPKITARPKEIEVTRHTSRATRNLDTSVVKDLMIHDLDLLLYLFGETRWTATEQARVIYSNHIDTIRAEIGFGDIKAYVSASRDSTPERCWILRYENGTIEIDFAAKTLRHDTPFDLDSDFGKRPDVIDNLRTAFDQFVRACLDGGPVLVKAEEGLAALELAETLEKDAPR